MPSTTIDYSKSECPNFDAVQDIIDWFGPAKWEEISPMMAKVTNREHFACYAGLAGIRGFPVQAWYNLYHGQGSWEGEHA